MIRFYYESYKLGSPVNEEAQRVRSGKEQIAVSSPNGIRVQSPHQIKNVTAPATDLSLDSSAFLCALVQG